MPRKSVFRLTDHPDMTLDVYLGRKTTTEQQQQYVLLLDFISLKLSFRPSTANYVCLVTCILFS